MIQSSSAKIALTSFLVSHLWNILQLANAIGGPSNVSHVLHTGFLVE